MPSTSNFYPQTDRSSVKNANPGYTRRAYIAPRRWFDALQVAVGALGADALTITADHTFLAASGSKDPGGGFIPLYAQPNTVQGDSDTASDAGTLVDLYKPQLFLPGDSPELQQMLNMLMNDDLIVIVEESNAPGASYVQYGSDGLEAHLTKKQFTSGQTNTGKKGWMLQIEAPTRFTYTGAVTEMA